MKALLSISAGLFLFLYVATASGQCPNVAGTQVTMLPPVTGAPLTADLVNEFSHLGREGNRVQEETHGKIYRDSQGRGRCDIENVKTKEISWASISDPVAQIFVHLDLQQKTAIVTHHRQTSQPAAPPKPNSATKPPVNIQGPDSKHSEEDLGIQAIGGFRTTGRRYTNTLETGEHSVMDEWYSPDLKITLLSTRDDGRSNTTANKVVNIQSSDPDPALFQVPEGYTVKNKYCRGFNCTYDSE